LSKSSGDIVITIDDDLSHPIEHLPKLIEKFKFERKEILYLIPEKYHYPWYRKFLSDVYKRISRYENPDAGKGSSFRIMSKTLVNSILQHSSHLIVIDELILWYTQEIGTVVLNFHPSQKLKSSYSYKRLFQLSKSTLMISTTMPLVIVKMIGVVVSSLSFLAGIYYLFKNLFFIMLKKDIHLLS
jgi:hypothetical protein